VRLEALPFILVAGIAAAATAFFLTPLAMRFARATGAMDEPDSGRRIHSRPIPRAGGLAVAASFLGVGMLSLYLNAEFDFFLTFAFRVQRDELAALFIGAALATVFGYIDDRWQIQARWQFGLQVTLAIVAIAGGVLITFIANPFDFLLGGGPENATLRFGDLDFVVYLVTALWVVGMINSINFIDGLDGLSTGVAIIAAVTLGAISLATGTAYAPTVALLCAVLAGALAGFLPWNFHPAKVFIGTTGVMLAGYALAVLAILGTAKIAVALLILGVPIIDTFYIILRRLFSGHSPFTPDRGHIHHRLLDLGVGHRDAVLLIYGLTVVLALLGFILSGGAEVLYAFMGLLVGFGLLIYLITWRSGREAALEASSYPDDGTNGDSQPTELNEPTPSDSEPGSSP
jgi:UDP-GlcNAc:undecaprenyl-phosphate GlcNAc-1-phosphate transferase